MPPCATTCWTPNPQRTEVPLFGNLPCESLHWLSITFLVFLFTLGRLTHYFASPELPGSWFPFKLGDGSREYSFGGQRGMVMFYFAASMTTALNQMVFPL